MEITGKPRKLFEVMIYDKYYDVYDVEGKEHGGWNGEPKTWWLYYADRLPEGTLPSPDSDSWEPWNSSIKRCVWDIRFNQRNSTKEKWGETRFSNSIGVEMYCNGKLFYSFSTNDLAYAMAKVQYLQVKMSEHSFNFFEPQKENGRRIWWYNLPATVVVSNYYPWEIRIKPDYSTGLNKEEWWKLYQERRAKRLSAENIYVDTDMPHWDEEDDEDKNNDLINWGDALSDGNIWWFRDETNK